jgi:hypothetical protein
MDRRSAAALAYSVAAIYVVVTAIVQLGYAAQGLAREVHESGALTWADFQLIGMPMIGTLALLGALAWVLESHCHRLAARLFPEKAPEPASAPAPGGLDVNDLHRLAFTVVGLIVLCFAVPDVIYLATDAWRSRAALNPWIGDKAAPLAGVLVQLATGYVLFFFPGAALRLWSRFGGRRRG